MLPFTSLHWLGFIVNGNARIKTPIFCGKSILCYEIMLRCLAITYFHVFLWTRNQIMSSHFYSDNKLNIYVVVFFTPWRFCWYPYDAYVIILWMLSCFHGVIIAFIALHEGLLKIKRAINIRKRDAYVFSTLLVVLRIHHCVKNTKYLCLRYASGWIR